MGDAETTRGSESGTAGDGGDDESDPYVREGRNAFAKFVREVADGVRPGAEAVVVADDAVVGVGRAVLRPAAMRAFETGVAVEVRHGAGDAEAEVEA